MHIAGQKKVPMIRMIKKKKTKNNHESPPPLSTVSLRTSLTLNNSIRQRQYDNENTVLYDNTVT